MESSSDYILGIGGSDHDFCAALLLDGKVVIAIEDERINRIKHGRGDWNSKPCQPAVEYCLEGLGITIGQINKVYANSSLEKRAFDWLSLPTINISHHLAHASATFYQSPFRKATILVVDGAGSTLSLENGEEERESVSIGIGIDRELQIDNIVTGSRHQATCSWRYYLTNSLGHFYRCVTYAIGFGHMGAGKTMGLAPFGDKSLLEKMENYVTIDDSGIFQFDAYSGFYDWLENTISSAGNQFMVRARLASAAQDIFERAMISLSRRAFRDFPSPVLCLSGGCALNTVANRKIIENTKFDEIYIHPACGDSGTAIGSALWGYHNDEDCDRILQPRSNYGSIAFTGRKYKKTELIRALDSFPVFWHIPDDLIEYIIKHILEEKVIGIFQGGSEIGQRALGHRSIIASPVSEKMRDHINKNIKSRETFRPLAPITIEEKASVYFELSQVTPFMNIVCKVNQEYRKALGAVTHIDGTARLQTVHRESDPFIHQLLTKLDDYDKPPVLLNTSFNVRGKPIVETPNDALEVFCSTKIDILYMDGMIAEKHTPWATR